jgi:hypothetical protein
MSSQLKDTNNDYHPQFDETTLINFLLSDDEQDILQFDGDTLKFQRYHMNDETLYYQCVYNDEYYWCNLNNYHLVPVFEINESGDVAMKFKAILSKFFSVEMTKEPEDA